DFVKRLRECSVRLVRRKPREPTRVVSRLFWISEHIPSSVSLPTQGRKVSPREIAIDDSLCPTNRLQAGDECKPHPKSEERSQIHNRAFVDHFGNVVDQIGGTHLDQ